LSPSSGAGAVAETTTQGYQPKPLPSASQTVNEPGISMPRWLKRAISIFQDLPSFASPTAFGVTAYFAFNFEHPFSDNNVCALSAMECGGWQAPAAPGGAPMVPPPQPSKPSMKDQGPGESYTDPAVQPTSPVKEKQTSDENPLVLSGGMPRHPVQHHNFPQNEKMKAWFEAKPRSIDVHEWTVIIEMEHHKAIHKWWNKEWQKFIDKHPNATKAQVENQAAKMMERAKILDKWMHRYLKFRPYYQKPYYQKLKKR
jgi:hypothetical protein